LLPFCFLVPLARLLIMSLFDFLNRSNLANLLGNRQTADHGNADGLIERIICFSALEVEISSGLSLTAWSNLASPAHH
jgi:hypothetical protein